MFIYKSTAPCHTAYDTAVRRGKTPLPRRGETPPLRRGETPPTRRGETPPPRRGETPPTRRGETRLRRAALRMTCGQGGISWLSLLLCFDMFKRVVECKACKAQWSWSVSRSAICISTGKTSFVCQGKTKVVRVNSILSTFVGLFTDIGHQDMADAQ